MKVVERGGQAHVSPDGRLLAYGGFGEIDGAAQALIHVTTLDGEARHELPWELALFFWQPDGDALIVNRQQQRVGNLWRQPLDGSEPERITRFESGFIIDADWDPGGEWIFVTRGETTSDVVLIHDFH